MAHGGPILSPRGLSGDSRGRTSHGVTACSLSVYSRRSSPDVSSYLEVCVNAPLDLCEQRDPKGLYRRACAGQLAHFTGIDDPYEVPESPDIECRTDLESVEECAAKIVRKLGIVLQTPAL